MAKVIGITGGIGSGKSTLLSYIETLGYPVYIADVEAKKLMDQEEIISKIQFLFNEVVLTEDNLLDRQKLAKIVFNDSKKLEKLNALIHPLVKKHFQDWVEAHANKPLVFKETAILFETGSYKECDYNILITAPLDIRIERVMKRDKIDRQTVLERVNKQWPDDEKAKLADFIIENVDLKLAKNEILDVINRIK